MTMVWRLVGVPLDCHAKFIPEGLSLPWLSGAVTHSVKNKISLVMHFRHEAWVLYCGEVTIELACSTKVVIDTTSRCSHRTSFRGSDLDPMTMRAPWTGHLSFAPLVLIPGGLTKRHVACGFPNCTTEYCGRMFLETRSSKEALGKPHCATAAGVKGGAGTETQSR
ncbi:hypothetical protein M404DRAFT_1003477 [Pisolithus tinctorius Marx 270]|uniref:Uncharacterized protein n=1 Tax=Pisolithus tinctorius Marx 270 TaxID=870435 RepID=A0A0C3P0A2_PISTI|nr:hypothetical protein M404DRAFT_1003477 [Pisolithus tinctorius Marx 270]